MVAIIKPKTRLPRKLKKALKVLRIYPDSGVVFRPLEFGNYPQTKWTVRGERQFRRLWRTMKVIEKTVKDIEEDLERSNLGDQIGGFY